MVHEGVLYVPRSGAFLVLVECVCGNGPCVLSITLMGRCAFDIDGTPTIICTCHYRIDGPH